MLLLVCGKDSFFFVSRIVAVCLFHCLIMCVLIAHGLFWIAISRSHRCHYRYDDGHLDSVMAIFGLSCLGFFCGSFLDLN